MNAHAPADTAYENIEKIINRDWKTKVPHFSVRTKQKEIEDKLKKIVLEKQQISIYQSALLQDLIYTSWLIALTIGETGLIYLYYIQNMKIIRIEERGKSPEIDSEKVRRKVRRYNVKEEEKEIE